MSNNAGTKVKDNGRSRKEGEVTRYLLLEYSVAWRHPPRAEMIVFFSFKVVLKFCFAPHTLQMRSKLC